MTTPGQNLLARIASTEATLRNFSEDAVARKPTPERWSKKEILGHLIDSAANNHQRFVRAMLESELAFPGYDQQGWTRAQSHADADWNELLNLWAAYNRHLARIMDRIPPDKLLTPCRIGAGEPVSLAWLMQDYIHHLDHHLAQLLDPDR